MVESHESILSQLLNLIKSPLLQGQYSLPSKPDQVPAVTRSVLTPSSTWSSPCYYKVSTHSLLNLIKSPLLQGQYSLPHYMHYII